MNMRSLRASGRGNGLDGRLDRAPLDRTILARALGAGRFRTIRRPVRRPVRGDFPPDVRDFGRYEAEILLGCALLEPRVIASPSK